MTLEDELQPPNKDFHDTVNAAWKAGLSAIPVVGGSAAVVFQLVFTEPVMERQQRWMDSVAKRLTSLSEEVEGLTPQKLSEDPLFISVAMQATQIAMRNHQEEKLLALRNAIINVARKTGAEYDRALLFTRLIDDLTPMHLIALNFASDTHVYVQRLQNEFPSGTTHEYRNAGRIWEASFPANDAEIDKLVFAELHQRGLAYENSLGSTSNILITTLGKEFVRFIGS